MTRMLRVLVLFASLFGCAQTQRMGQYDVADLVSTQVSIVAKIPKAVLASLSRQ
jgi:hypothetical protein